MKYLLDTNTCIRFLNDPSSPVADRLKALSPTDVVLCDIVKAELCFGAERSQRREQNLQTLDEFFGVLPSLPFEGRAARAYGRLRSRLYEQGTPIGSNDMLIAATAVAHRLILVTNNRREFERVAGLQIEDWVNDR